MKHNNWELDSDKLIFYFVEQDKHCFAIEEVYELYPNTRKGKIRELLRHMTNRGKLSRIKEGLYLVIPLGKSSGNFIPDWHQLTEYLVQDANHYIGYYSALQIHNLITQPSLKQQIVV